MYPKKHLLLLLFVGFLATAQSQSNPYIGTFINASQTITLQFKQEGKDVHGIFATQGTSLAIKATVNGQKMSGTIYGYEGPVEFNASMSPNGYTFTSPGYSEMYFKMSDQHMLAGMDLTPFMVDLRQSKGTATSPTEDYDYGYSQTSRGNASEEYQVRTGRNTTPSPYPALNDRELQNLIGGSQVVYYTRTSYVNSNTASSITYVNFCANGTFTRNTDGSFMVEGYYGDNAQGASRSQHSGTWELVRYKGQPAVWMSFYNGQTSVNPINKASLQQGRWRIGNTQYAIQRNKVGC